MSYGGMFMNTPLFGSITGASYHRRMSYASEHIAYKLKKEIEQIGFWINNYDSGLEGSPKLFKIFSSDEPDAERKRLILMKKVRIVDIRRNQMVLAISVHDGIYHGGLYECVEDALEQLLYGNCSLVGNDVGDVFLSNDTGRFELAYLSMTGRMWYNGECANPKFGPDKEYEYEVKTLGLVSGMAVVLGDLDGQFAEFIDHKYGPLDCESV